MEWLDRLKGAKAELDRITDVGADYLRKIAEAGRKAMDAVDAVADSIDPTPGGAVAFTVADETEARNFLAECERGLQAQGGPDAGRAAGIMSGTRGPGGRLILELIIEAVKVWLANRQPRS